MADSVFTLTVDVSGLQRLIKETPGKVEKFLDAEAEQITNNIKASFGESPSSPGEPPGVDTGALRASISWRALSRFARRIEDGVEYGVYQELGTEHIAPRPFVGPEFERARRRLGQDARVFGLVE